MGWGITWLLEGHPQTFPCDGTVRNDMHRLSFRNLNILEEFQQGEAQTRSEESYQGRTFLR